MRSRWRSGAPMIYYGGETGIDGEFAEDGRRCMPWDSLDMELVNWTKGAIATRRNFDYPLRVGTYQTVVMDDAQKVYGFARTHNQQTVYALFSQNDAPVTVTIPDIVGNWRDALNGGEFDFSGCGWLDGDIGE